MGPSFIEQKSSSLLDMQGINGIDRIIFRLESPYINSRGASTISSHYEDLYSPVDLAIFTHRVSFSFMSF